MAAKLRVTTPVGVFTRRTERTYTHIVVARGERPDVIRARSAANLAYHQKLVKEYQAVVAGGPLAPCYEDQRDQYPRYLEGAQEDVDQSDAVLAKRLAASEASTHGIVGWCGRLDLARKLADRTAQELLDVRIFQLDGQEVR